MDSQVDTMDSQVDTMDSQIDTMDSQVDAMDSQVDTMDSQVDTMISTARSLRRPEPQVKAGAPQNPHPLWTPSRPPLDPLYTPSRPLLDPLSTPSRPHQWAGRVFSIVGSGNLSLEKEKSLNVLARGGALALHEDDAHEAVRGEGKKRQEGPIPVPMPAGPRPRRQVQDAHCTPPNRRPFVSSQRSLSAT
eukprot:7351479-Pyramimonas_sp.AAC.1